MKAIIVGGGVMGLATAWALARSGHHVGLFEQGTLPPTLHYEEPDPECPVRVLTQPRRVERPHFLKVGFTDVGQCAAVVIKKWD